MKSSTFLFNHIFLVLLSIGIPVAFIILGSISSLSLHPTWTYCFIVSMASRGTFGFSSFINHPGIEFQDLLLELMPILDTLSALEKPAVDQMIEIFMDPSSSSLEQLKWRKDASQRKSTNRRASDRRIVDITLHINRRALQRRGEERRLGIRR